MTQLRVACIQLRSGTEIARNVTDATQLIREAAAQGAKFIATPEMTTILQRRPRLLMEALPDPDEPLPEVAAFAALAAALNIHLLIGSMAVALNKQAGQRLAANRSFLFSPKGETMGSYDKLHMFDVDLPNGESWKESSVYKPGEGLVIGDLGPAKLGLSICYDVRFPSLYRTYAQAGAEIIAVPAAFTKQTGEAHWEVLLRARAIETGSFIIAPAQGGTHEDERETWGHSLIVDPWGKVLAEADHDRPGFITADLDLAAVADARQRIPNLRHDHPALEGPQLAKTAKITHI